MTDALLLAEQAKFDPVAFDPENGYLTLESKDAKIRHIFVHSVKAAGKLALGLGEQIVSEVIPDLCIYRSQLINIANIPGEIFPLPYMDKGIGGLPDVKDQVSIANFRLSQYLEPREHGNNSSNALVVMAAYNLHGAVLGLGELYDINPVDLHLNRLSQLLGERLTQPLIQTPTTTST